MVPLFRTPTTTGVREKRIPRVLTSLRLVFERSHPATRAHYLVCRRFGRHQKSFNAFCSAQNETCSCLPPKFSADISDCRLSIVHARFPPAGRRQVSLETQRHHAMLVCEVSLGRAYQAKTHNLHGKICPVPGFDSTEAMVRGSPKNGEFVDVHSFLLPAASSPRALSTSTHATSNRSRLRHETRHNSYGVQKFKTLKGTCSLTWDWSREESFKCVNMLCTEFCFLPHRHFGRKSTVGYLAASPRSNTETPMISDTVCTSVATCWLRYWS